MNSNENPMINLSIQCSWHSNSNVSPENEFYSFSRFVQMCKNFRTTSGTELPPSPYSEPVLWQDWTMFSCHIVQRCNCQQCEAVQQQCWTLLLTVVSNVGNKTILFAKYCNKLFVCCCVFIIGPDLRPTEYNSYKFSVQN